jgi:hypothetical protein
MTKEGVMASIRIVFVFLTVVPSLIVSALTVAGSSFQTGQGQNGAIVGTWQGKFEKENLPAITLILREEGDKLTGSVISYKYRTDNEGHPELEKKYEEPLTDPKFDGKTLSFKMKFEVEEGKTIELAQEMRLLGGDKAELNEVGKPNESIRMTREK